MLIEVGQIAGKSELVVCYKYVGYNQIYQSQSKSNPISFSGATLRDCTNNDALKEIREGL